MSDVDWPTVRLAAAYFDVPANDLERDLQLMQSDRPGAGFPAGGCCIRTQTWPFGMCGRGVNDHFGHLGVYWQHANILTQAVWGWIDPWGSAAGATVRDLARIVEELHSRLRRIEEQGQWDDDASRLNIRLKEILSEYLNARDETERQVEVDRTRDALTAIWGAA